MVRPVLTRASIVRNPGAERRAPDHLRILATFVSALLQPSFDGLSAIPHMTAYPIAGWPVALVPLAVQSLNGDAQHFRDIVSDINLSPASSVMIIFFLGPACFQVFDAID
jgi:hypothetical protein